MANVFNTDPNCIAVYKFDNGALTVDSQGDNTLTNYGGEANAADYQEGDACVDIVGSEEDYLECLDVNLDSGFPGKSSETHDFMSMTCWFKLRSWGPDPSGAAICGKWFTGHWYSWTVYVKSDKKIYLAWTTDGDIFIQTVSISGLEFDTWYHVGAVLNAISNRAYLELYNDSSQTVTTATQTNYNVVIAPKTLAFQVGRHNSYAEDFFDGYIDELCIFKDALTSNEIKAIRQGHYGDWVFLSGRANALASLTGKIGGPVNMCVDLSRFHPETRYRERLLWRTDIIKGADGSEQRLATRCPPRQQIRLPYILETPQDSARAQAMLHKWAKRQWGLPIWHERIVSYSSLSAGATTISIDTTAGDFRDDSFGLLWQPNQYEIVDIQTKTDSQLNLSAPLVNNYSGQTFVIPYRRARLIDPPKRRRYQGGGAILEMPFEVVDNAEVSGHTAANSYDSMDVLITPAYLPDGIYDERHEPDVIILDGLTGAVEVARVSDFNITDQPHLFIAETPAEAWSYRQFLYAILGRQKKFLVPTFAQDFDLTRQIGAADTTIYVANIGLAAHMGANAMREYIGFRTGGRGSTLTIRRITGISQIDSSEESLTLNAAIGSVIPVDSLLCWVDQCRLASDAIDIDWVRPGVCVSPARLVRVT